MKMENKTQTIWNQFFIVFIFISFPTGYDSQCEFPALFRGEYILSRINSVVTVSPNNITGITLHEALILESVVGKTYVCVANTDSKYVLRSALGAREPGESEDRYVYFCMDLTVVSQTKTTYVQATNTGPGRRPYDSKYLSATAVGLDPVSSVCDIPVSSYISGKNSIFLKTSEEASWPQTCPDVILGVYTNNDPDCPVTADVCTDNRYIQLDNTTSCAVSPFFSVNGSVTCVHEVSSGSITYLHLYNNDSDVDNKNTFRYTCVALEKTVDGVLMSQNPGDCVANQIPDNATAEGQLTFSFTQPDVSKLCPITTTSTTTVTTSTATNATFPVSGGGLSTAGSVGLAFGILGLLALLVLLILCLVIRREKKKRKMEEEARRREERRQERRRQRREMRLKRMEEDGLVQNGDDSDSSDSGYSGRSIATLVRPEEEEEEEAEEEKQEEKVMKDEDLEKQARRDSIEETGIMRMRRVYDVDGNLLYEEEIPESDEHKESDENEEDVEEKRRKKKRLKKTRKYIRDKTLPDGTVVQELVESDYWSSVSEMSTESCRQDPVRIEMHKARLKRKRDRRSILEKSAGDKITSLVHRPEIEKRSFITLPRIFHKFALGKRRLTEDVSAAVHDVPDSDRFLPQYHDKKQTERKLDDEGFWEDPKSKKSALEIFDFDNLDAQLDESVKSARSSCMTRASTDTEMPSEDLTHEEQKKSETDRGSRVGSRSLRSAHSREAKQIKLPTIEVPSGFVSGSHEDTCEELPITDDSEEKVNRQRGNDRQRILATLSRLLTDRLFSEDGTEDLDTHKPGKVIFVEENEKDPQRSASRPGSRETAERLLHSTEDRPGDNVDQNRDQVKIETTKSLELPRLVHGPHRQRYISHGKRGIGPERASFLRHGLQNNSNLLRRHMRAPRPPQEAWADPQSETDYRTWYLQNRTLANSDDVPFADSEYRKWSQDGGYLDLDDARLRRLLEELYKDKKYMDALVAAEVSSSHDEVRSLAQHGRDYLLQMALYWEEKGPLPPRPSTTALGFKLERARTASSLRAQTAQTSKLERNKTTC